MIPKICKTIGLLKKLMFNFSTDLARINLSMNGVVPIECSSNVANGDLVFPHWPSVRACVTSCVFPRAN